MSKRIHHDILRKQFGVSFPTTIEDLYQCLKEAEKLYRGYADNSRSMTDIKNMYQQVVDELQQTIAETEL